jgi:NADP-dependent aldehyde dehydrogenase
MKTQTNPLTGAHLIGSKLVYGASRFKSYNPFDGTELETNYSEAHLEHANLAANLAETAFASYRNTSSKQRAKFLDTIADEILNIGDKLLDQVHLETALPLTRIEGERGRTCAQLRLFAEILREGSWVNAIIDTADKNRAPIQKPDTRSMQIPIGPVAVFGASNFPLAFSVAGGDTASALAAGCPVIVKAHPAHPGTSELIAQAIIKAIKTCGLGEGIFSLIQSSNYQISEILVNHPKIKAVGFTGSLKAGRYLYNLAVSRPEPIPFYGELGSINPVFVLEDAFKNSAKSFVSNYLASLTMGVGQFCTNPGLIVAKDSVMLDSLLEQLSVQIQDTLPGSMLTKPIQQSFINGIKYFRLQSSVDVLAETEFNPSNSGAQNIIFTVSAEEFITNPNLHEEVFGPVALVVICKSNDELMSVADSLKGQLTATIHTQNTQTKLTQALLNKLTQIAGRVLFNGFPTGVEVNRSMVHGGCYPAATDCRSTSVGTGAIYRFTRAVCFQDTPENLLPTELKNDNPLKIYRMIDAELTKE